MTLIHTEITSRWALQVSDRLLTEASANHVINFDTCSNKTVVFYATDGIATLSYTGLALLEHSPTDSWIASKLNGTQHPFNPREIDFTIRFGIKRTTWPKLGLALIQLANELNTLATPRNSCLRAMPVTIAVAGWLWYRRKQSRPFIALIGKSNGGRYVVDWAPRQYGQYFLHLIAPRHYVPSNEQSEINDRLATIALPEEATTVLASSIRRVAARTKTVGADCMAVSISHPNVSNPKIRTEFLLNDGEVPSQARTSPRFVAYSPWVVGPHECFPPARMVGGGAIALRVGIYDFERIGPSRLHPPPAGISLLLDVQKRRLK